jgi:hypothetical protein
MKCWQDVDPEPVLEYHSTCSATWTSRHYNPPAPAEKRIHMVATFSEMGILLKGGSDQLLVKLANDRFYHNQLLPAMFGTHNADTTFVK